MNRINVPGPSLPPGFRFHPTDQELIVDYLKQKVASSSNPHVSIIAVVNIYKFDPWQLPGKAVDGENEFFFFSPRDKKYPNGSRPNRTAASGYWKATGTDKPILSSGGSECLGVKKALVFYTGKPPNATKTDWMMLEYRLLDDNTVQQHRPKESMRLDDWVLCRVRQKGNISQSSEKEANDNISKNQVGAGSSLYQGSLRGQEINVYNYGFHDPGEVEKMNEQESTIHDLVQEGSPGPSGSTANSSAVNEALESIKRALSFEALDDFLGLIPPRKRLNVDSSSMTEKNANMSPSVSASYPRSF